MDYALYIVWCTTIFQVQDRNVESSGQGVGLLWLISNLNSIGLRRVQKIHEEHWWVCPREFPERIIHQESAIQSVGRTTSKAEGLDVMQSFGKEKTWNGGILCLLPGLCAVSCPWQRKVIPYICVSDTNRAPTFTFWYKVDILWMEHCNLVEWWHSVPCCGQFVLVNASLRPKLLKRAHPHFP